MKYKKTSSLKTRLRQALFSIGCLVLISTGCEKEEVKDEKPNAPGKPLQLPHGKPVGEIAIAQIGKEGGTLVSKDGIVKMEVPAGAVDEATAFSIQEVENVMKTQSRSYRLLPENVTFKKPVTLTYHYADIEMEGVNPDYLFLAFQDKDGFFYWANKTRGNRQNKTLTVQTTHFSDWTFYSQYDLYLAGNKLSGDLNLVIGQEVVIELKATPVVNYDEEYGPIQVPELSSGIFIQTAVWDFEPKKGEMKVDRNQGAVTYQAPQRVSGTERVYINVTINGKLGKDNLGNEVQQIQIRQPVIIRPDEYFVIKEDGVEMSAYNYGAEYAGLLGTQVLGMFNNGYILSLYAYGGTGGYSYNEHSTPGAAVIELVQNGKGLMSMRPKSCVKNEGLYFSPGAYSIRSIAHKKGDYFEGSFTVTLFGYDWCPSGRTKKLSGSFRIRKTGED